MGIESNRINNELNNYFKLDNIQSIVHYFPHDKNNIQDVVVSKINRILHFFRTGVWINEDKICKWAQEHPDDNLSVLFKGKGIERKIIRYKHDMVIVKPNMLESLQNTTKFFLEFVKDPKKVGAILPSSKRLASEIVKEIPKDLKAEKRLILEVGPGTGVFTDKILQRMNPTDELHLVEFDEEFCIKLREKYKHIPRVKIFHASILDHQVEPEKKYDYVISGLPLNAFQSDFVEAVFKKFTEIVRENGKISYFEYIVITEIKKIFSSSIEKKNLDKIMYMKREFYRKHELKKTTVLFNAPLARVLHHHIKPN